jgi:hypothetical protein
MISTSNEVGDGTLLSWDRAGGPLVVAIVALLVNLCTGFLRRRLDR